MSGKMENQIDQLASISKNTEPGTKRVATG
jgi:hypothetical protein